MNAVVYIWVTLRVHDRPQRNNEVMAARGPIFTAHFRGDVDREKVAQIMEGNMKANAYSELELKLLYGMFLQNSFFLHNSTYMFRDMLIWKFFSIYCY